ncbi:methylated-DNA-[protein]-cysteine S-methyltransferase [Novosphingobium sp. PhB165]|uniref:methylated-DNA--[protein]-cysteine S-methyltransferase n=1 Tax=Novosphingobium sp. PhB165 TaxID=2485105 RepID=UPI00104CF324|nr:methylated-DNA--[protein]-cysteine S-methyltransferase [Novosphingobium sp. PhB165]TCM16033.1 methylated-DNA-[protein]-cysteine S-methyltransferase [Novosphingobium sp. PhB165]
MFETSYGFAAIGWRGSSVSCFRLPSRTAEAAESALLRRFPTSIRTAPPAFLQAVIRDAQRYFEGERVDFSAVEIDLGEQEPLFERIYGFVRALDYGETTTYGAVAKALGEEPQTARTVGEAMSRNPVPLIVPCHRVTAAGGKIGGFSAPGGSDTKAHMLSLEGVASSSNSQIGFGF